MKKLIPVLFICILAIIFTSCGNKQINIEECDWQLQSVANLNDNGESVSVGDITLTAKDGEIIIKDVTNVETYKGAYEEMLVTDIKDDYKIILEGKEGYMSLSESENGEVTLLLTVDGYDLCFFIK
jgi:hypothetical protein